jgi:hypothetical protein
MNHIKACCESIARTGFGTLQLSETMLLDYKKIVDGYSTISPATKASLRISRTCVSDFVTGLRIHQNERLLNSHEASFLLPLMLLNNRSASLPRH